MKLSDNAVRSSIGEGQLFTVGTMSLTNFQLNSDFKWLLLIPPLLWVIGLLFSRMSG